MRSEKPTFYSIDDLRFAGKSIQRSFADDASKPRASVQGFEYIMPRPAWLGFMDFVREETGTGPRLGSDGFTFATDKPLSLETAKKFELRPLNDDARLALADEVLSGRINVVSIRDGGASVRNAFEARTGVVMVHSFDINDDSDLELSSGSEVMSEGRFSPLAHAMVGICRDDVQQQFTFSTSALNHTPVSAEATRSFCEANAVASGLHVPEPLQNTYVDDLLPAYFELMARRAGKERAQAIHAFWQENAAALQAISGAPRWRNGTLSDLLAQKIGGEPAPVATPQTTAAQTAPSVAAPVTPQPQTVQTQWVDLSDVDVFIGEQKLASGQTRLVLLDMGDRYDAESLSAVGFLPMPGLDGAMKGIYLKDGPDQTLKVRALAGALNLPSVKVVRTTKAAVAATFKQKANERYQRNIESLLMVSHPIGQNFAGYTVYQTPTGRFLRNDRGQAFVEDSLAGRRLGAGAFLYADDQESLRLVADGMINMIRHGARFNKPELAAMADRVFAHHLTRQESGDLGSTAVQQHALQEAIEASAFRSFLTSASGISRESFDMAKSLYFSLPTATIRTNESIDLQQYSTPLPMSAVAQRLLFGNDEVSGKSVLEPTAGNGGLLTLMPADAKVFGVELDPTRFESLKAIPKNIRTHRGDATITDFKGVFGQADGYDYVITNPPFGAMAPQDFPPFERVNKLDHWIPLKALEARKNSGRSVIIVGSDSPRSNGEVSQTSRQFLNYLSDYYELEGAVELDGRLYSRQGTSYNVRMIVVGDRRPEPIQSPQTWDSLPVIREYDELWNWSSDLISSYGSKKTLVAAPAPAPLTDDMVLGADFDLEEEPSFGDSPMVVSAAPVRVSPTLSDDREAAKTFDKTAAEAVRAGLSSEEVVAIVEAAKQTSETIAEMHDSATKGIQGAVDALVEKNPEPVVTLPEPVERTSAEVIEMLDSSLDASISISEDAPSVAMLMPWEMTRDVWEAAMYEARTSEPSPSSRAREEFLEFEVNRWAIDRMAMHESGELPLSAAELESVSERMNTAVTHRDVIDRALSQQLPVPRHVLRDYPELSADQAMKNNAYQVPYQSASRTAEASTMIPINMASSVYAALSDLEAEHGDIDEFVANRLQMDVTEIGAFFSPEQIDALGLSISAVEKGRGMINADQTGVGKGRWVAGMLRYAKLAGKLPIFTTYKPELFTDIFRDIGDIGSGDLFKKVFIFNDGVNIKKFGSTNEVLFPATKADARRKAIEEGAVPEDTDLVLLTYSQLSRSLEKNPKAGLLSSLAASNAILLLDEAHQAAGVSNTNVAMTQACAAASGVLYASATAIKGVKSFSIYNKIFPSSVDLKNLPETLESGGESLMEAISTNMARDGVLIRREHDLSQLTLNTISPTPEEQGQLNEYADKLSAILSRLAYMSGDVGKEVVKLNKQFEKDREEIPESERVGNRMQASSMNFFSRNYSIVRQFLMAVKVEKCIDYSMSALAEGRKPVFAVENTGESYTREVILRRTGMLHKLDEIEALEQVFSPSPEQTERLKQIEEEMELAIKDVSLDKLPQFREMLESMLERVSVIKVVGRYGDVSYKQPESEEFAQYAEETLELIHEFPDLALTPLDMIKEAFAAKGLKCAEVSGRGISLIPNADTGRYDVKYHSKIDPVEQVAGYQNGTYDGIIITRAGSTGISLHATNRNADSDIRQRDFIIMQPAQDIADYMQWCGRVNRKDQVVPPVITTAQSGLPAELRMVLMFNAKLRRLCANTTSNRENSAANDDIEDVLNFLGDQVAVTYLLENPDVADIFGISVESSEEINHHEAKYINRLMGRVSMLTVERQEKMIALLTDRYAERLTEMRERGIDPFAVTVYDWKARVVTEEPLQSTSLMVSDSSFDEPVKLVKVAYDVEVKPLRSADIDGLIAAGMTDYCAHPHSDQHGQITGFRNLLLAARDDYIRESLPIAVRAEERINQLLDNAPKDKLLGAKASREKADWLISTIRGVRPGQFFTHSDPMQGDRIGVITAVRFPVDDQKLFMLSNYTVSVAFPGEEQTKSFTLATLRANGYTPTPNAWTDTSTYSMARRMRKEFDDVPDGNLVREKWLLMGNTYRACEMAAAQKMGSPVLFTNEDGNRMRGVLLRSSVTPEMVKSVPIPLMARDVVEYEKRYVAKNGRPNSYNGVKPLIVLDRPVMASDNEVNDGIVIKQGTYGYMMSMPGSKAKFGKVFSDPAIFATAKEASSASGLGIKMAGNRVLSGSVSNDILPALVERLQKNGHVEKFYIPDLDQGIVNEIRVQYRDEAEKQARKEARKQRRADARAESAYADVEMEEPGVA